MANMKILGGTVVVILAILQLGTAPPSIFDALCETCDMENGVGYVAFMYDCTSYVSCAVNYDESLRGSLQPCPFPLYWDDTDLTCKEIQNTTCTLDMCTGESDGVRFPGNLNCRGYWQCLNQIAVPFCCPTGQFFNSVAQTCDNNGGGFTCTDDCLDGQPIVQCDMTILTPTSFTKNSNGIPYVMDCPSGTGFSTSTCSCSIFLPYVPTLDTCEPVLHLPFTTDAQDESGNKHYVKNENVIVSGGSAIFNGIDSRLTIPFFSNLESYSVIAIEITLSSAHDTLTSAQGILSNNDCDCNPSIQIIETSDTMELTLGTSDVSGSDVDTTLSVDQTPGDNIKMISYNYIDGILRGKIETMTGVMFEAVSGISGPLRNVHCALHIGYAKNNNYFLGAIDDIKVWPCNPYA